MTWRVEHGREELMQSRGRLGKSSQTAQEYKDEVVKREAEAQSWSGPSSEMEHRHLTPAN
jgi:hypothetical protein